MTPSHGASGSEPAADESAAERANRRICALFDACRDAGTATGSRDAALLSVLYGANVPRRAALALPRAAYDAAAGRLEPPGQGTPARWATRGAREALGDWVRLRGEQPGPLFCPLRDGRPLPGRRLAPGAVDAVLRRWARAAEVEQVRPRAFRELYRSPWWSGTPGSGSGRGGGSG